MADQITSPKKDFSQWYSDVILKAELASYAPVRGCMVIRPYGWALWENMKSALDRMIKESGVKNAYFPLFIPLSFLQKEKEHVEGFSPQLAIVTRGGGKKLAEPLVVRPTSETIIYRMYADWIQSYRDLPLRLNQWANVVRWELRTYLFLRTMEFLWQEGHTAHATHKEAKDQAKEALFIYRDFYRHYLAIDPFIGEKSETERFAGALTTLGVEALVRDGRFIQAATSHDLGQNFSKAFGIKFQDKDKKLRYVWQTSWGLSTRALGTLIMAHGDDKGLILPPKVAPIQVVIVPIPGELKKEKLKRYIEKTASLLKDVRIEVDWREGLTPGYKFNDWELKGVPIRLEIGDQEVKEETVTLVSRLNQDEKLKIKRERLKLKGVLDRFQTELLARYRRFVGENSHSAGSWKEFREIIKKKRGAVSAFWCGDPKCEAAIKAETKATTRVLPLRSKKKSGHCVYCRKKADSLWIWGRGY